MSTTPSNQERTATLSTNTSQPRGCLGYKIALPVTIGLTAGILSGLLGIGGGVILVPAMVYLLHLSQREAHGTSLVVVLCTATMGAFRYAEFGNVRWGVALELAIGGVIGAMIGARLCSAISNRRLRQIFSVFMVLIGLRMLVDWVSVAFAAPAAQAQMHMVDTTSFGGGLLAVVLGILTGILSGLLGVGGGVIMIPALRFVLGFSQVLAQGISLAVIVPVSLSGSLMHYRQGNVRGAVGIWLIAGGVLGSIAGSQWANKMGQTSLTALFGLLMLAFGLSMLRSRERRAAESHD